MLFLNGNKRRFSEIIELISKNIQGSTLQTSFQRACCQHESWLARSS